MTTGRAAFGGAGIFWACGVTPLMAPMELMALAATIVAMLSHALHGSDWPRTTRPMTAASTGLMLMKIPK